MGIALIFGILTNFSVLMGMTMNFAYLFSGTTSTNPQMALIGMFILVAGINAGKIGLDRRMIPYFKRLLLKKEDQEKLPLGA